MHRTTLRIKTLMTLPNGNTNGIAVSPDGGSLYMADTGASQVRPSRRVEQGLRDLWAFDFATSKTTGNKLPLLTNQRLLTRAITYFYDGAGGEVVDIIDPESGWILGSIRVGGGGKEPVNMVLGEHELLIVGKGGVWHVNNIRKILAREW
ncbi:hypothetical protein PG996_009928 [Apiospora saccharicola]|uniref:SMP-30/Gluconolactonase/LRE-like region domain-containing protein n=1 Tax=Apiospora saccharicola TaxID=335842 RepID=A0ABR1UM45_9PEZI